MSKALPQLPPGIFWSPPYIYQRPSGYLTRVVAGMTYRSGQSLTILVARSGVDDRDGEGDLLATITLSQWDKFTVEDDLMEEVSDLDHIIVTAYPDPTARHGESAPPGDLTVTLTFVEAVD